MKETVRTMLESDFGFNMTGYSKNKEIFERISFASKEVIQMTGFTPEKVIVLNDNNTYYIEFCGNLERLMEDADISLQEAIDEVTMYNNIAACDVNIILDECCIDRINLDEMIKLIGIEHIFRK